MEGFLEIFNQYARSELLVLVPVLYVINNFLGSSKISNDKIPMITSGISVLLCALYTFSIVPIININTGLLALFTSATQGILFAGASILGNIVVRQGALVSSSDKNKQKNDTNGKE